MGCHKRGVQQTATETLGNVKAQSTKQWLSDRTRQLADERRRLKGKKGQSAENAKHYNFLGREIKSCGTADKEAYLNEICKNVEDANAQNKSRAVYQSVRQITGKKEKRVRAVKDKIGIVITDPEKVKDRWKEHFEELYNGKSTADAEMLKELPAKTEDETRMEDTTPKLMREEIEAAVKKMKVEKAPGWTILRWRKCELLAKAVWT